MYSLHDSRLDLEKKVTLKTVIFHQTRCVTGFVRTTSFRSEFYREKTLWKVLEVRGGGWGEVVEGRNGHTAPTLQNTYGQELGPGSKAETYT